MRIHFIGIGGIGVSALAKYYLAKGHKVTGSDLVASEITDSLKKLGAKISIGPHSSMCLRFYLKQPDLVIYSPAIPSSNPELKETKRLKIKCQSYPEALGELTKKYFTIAVSGTHGKSTTTAMIGLLLTKAGLDPTVIVGTKLKEFGDSNCRVGKSQYLVIEADEHMASFLNYWPKIIVLTTIEKDHLDYYKNLKNILKTFKKYVSHLPKNGFLIANKDDENSQKLICRGRTSTNGGSTSLYSLKQRRDIKKLKKILKIPGEYNISNALAALTVGRALGIGDRTIFHVLSQYKGSWRRFEIRHTNLREAEHETTRKITIVSDYAHHPTEIKVTLKAAREKYPKREIWCVFQPHQYQRTYYLFDDFVKTFRTAPVNKLIITDIYDVAGREEKKIKEKVNSQKLVRAICRGRTSTIYLPKEKIIGYLKKNLKGGEVVIIMGAGDIYKLADHLTEKKIRKKIN